MEPVDAARRWAETWRIGGQSSDVEAESVL